MNALVKSKSFPNRKEVWPCLGHLTKTRQACERVIKNLGSPEVWERTEVGLGDAGALSFFSLLGLPCFSLREFSLPSFSSVRVVLSSPLILGVWMLDKKVGNKIPEFLRCFLAFCQKARQGMTGRGSAPDRAIEAAIAMVSATALIAPDRL